ncbi:MAG: heparan-alpha-glucosaminide N-acetyltransferase domain-containing protein [Sphingomonas sp.]
MADEQTKQRLTGLDIFRGLAVAGMIIVNTPGNWDFVWWPLDHAAWHGFTPTDLVFPAFLFAVGVALGLSFPKRIDSTIWRRIVRRTLLLIAIGWAFQFLVHPNLAHFRVFGVLVRIGLCYALTATLAILTARRDAEGRSHLNLPVLSGIIVAALLGYWALMALVPVPGFGAGQLTPEGNLAGYVDRMLATPAHMWSGGTDAAGNIVYDPEGLLSTIPALANVLFGMLAAALWKAAPDRSTLRIALAGAVLVVIGLAFAQVFPLNKKLWTSSFALLTSGLSAMLLALAMVATRSAAIRKALSPLHMLGMNAILGYILSLLIGIAGFKLHVGGDTLQGWCFAHLQLAIPDPWLASFAYAVIALLIVFAALLPLHRRGIHLRL